MSWFGTCVVPEHGFTKPPRVRNVITSKGALNWVVASQGDRRGADRCEAFILNRM